MYPYSTEICSNIAATFQCCILQYNVVEHCEDFFLQYSAMLQHYFKNISSKRYKLIRESSVLVQKSVRNKDKNDFCHCVDLCLC